MEDKWYTLTSPAGKFYFPRSVVLSKAKLVRDSLTAGSRGAIPHTPRPRPDNALAWLKNHVAGPLHKEVQFTWIPALEAPCST